MNTVTEVLPAVGGTLASYSWTDIGKIADAGQGDDYFNVGDTKDLLVNGTETMTMQIYDFNHDDKADDSGKANITFGSKDLMATSRAMNATNTNIGGWNASGLRTWMNGTLLSQLPTELKTAIKPVKKYTSSGNSSGSTLITSNDSVFVFSEKESFGTNVYSLAGEGSMYPIFTWDKATRVKKLSNGAGIATTYWGSFITNSTC